MKNKIGKACLHCKGKRIYCVMPGEEKKTVPRKGKGKAKEDDRTVTDVDMEPVSPRVLRNPRNPKDPKVEPKVFKGKGKMKADWEKLSETRRNLAARTKRKVRSRPPPAIPPNGPPEGHLLRLKRMQERDQHEKETFGKLHIPDLRFNYGQQTSHDKKVWTVDFLSQLYVLKKVGNLVLDQLISQANKELDNRWDARSWLKHINDLCSDADTPVRRGQRDSATSPKEYGIPTGVNSETIVVFSRDEFVQGSSGVKRKLEEVEDMVSKRARVEEDKEPVESMEDEVPEDEDETSGPGDPGEDDKDYEGGSSKEEESGGVNEVL